MAWECTYDEHTNPRRLYCNVCSKRVQSWTALDWHLQSKHGIPKGSIDGTYIALMCMHKHRGELTEEEYNHASPDPEDVDKFFCKLCGGNFRSSSALRHFEDVHQVPKASMRNWLVCKDGNAMRNQTRARPFREAYARYEHLANDATEDPIEEVDDTEVADVIYTTADAQGICFGGHMDTMSANYKHDECQL